MLKEYELTISDGGKIHERPMEILILMTMVKMKE
jgi:hypothetical protein